MEKGTKPAKEALGRKRGKSLTSGKPEVKLVAWPLLCRRSLQTSLEHVQKFQPAGNELTNTDPAWAQFLPDLALAALCQPAT